MDTSNIKIEQGVPLPPVQKAGQWYAIVCKMEVGDSFLAPIADGDRRAIGSLRATISTLSRRAGLRIVTRTVVGGLRVWLTKKKENQ